MFFFTKSVRSRIEPFVTASPMFWESRIGMSKLVLRAANWVKIASCHCGFGTTLTFTVTFGRVFVYSLPSSSSACAGGQSNHRNVSVSGLLVSCASAAFAAPPPLLLLSLLLPHATSTAAVASTHPAAQTFDSFPFIHSSSTQNIAVRLQGIYAFLAVLVNCIAVPCIRHHRIDSLRRHEHHRGPGRRASLRRARPFRRVGHHVAPLGHRGGRDRRRRCRPCRRRRLGCTRAARARRAPPPRLRSHDRASQ